MFIFTLSFSQKQLHVYMYEEWHLLPTVDLTACQSALLQGETNFIVCKSLNLLEHAIHFIV